MSAKVFGFQLFWHIFQPMESISANIRALYLPNDRTKDRFNEISNKLRIYFANNNWTEIRVQFECTNSFPDNYCLINNEQSYD